MPRSPIAPALLIATCGLFCMATRPGPAPEKNISSVYVRAEHLAELRTKFASNFRVYNGGTYSAIGGTEMEIRWGALKALIPSTLPEGSDDFGYRFHYGLDASNNFQVALEVVSMKRVSDKAEPYVNDAESSRMYSTDAVSEKLYVVEGKELVATDRAVWLATLQERYMQNVCIRRADQDSGFDRFHRYLDAQSEVFPWNMEMVPLAAQNGMGDSDLMVVSCIGDNAGWLSEGDDATGSDYQHALCLYFRGHIGDGVPTAPNKFQDHGANLGTLCPSRCALYIRPWELN